MMISIGQIAHSRRRFPAWLGICAILMLFIAPVVSKALVAQGIPVPMMAGMDMSSMEMSAAPMHEMSLSATHDMHNADQMSHEALPSSPLPAMSPMEMMDAACGYCVLLMHLPLLVLLAIPLLWSMAEVVRPPLPCAIQCPISAPLFSNSQPRAPPVTVLVA